VNVEVLIPRTRRAIDGPLASSSGATATTLADPEVALLIADSIADVIFYAGGVWGYSLSGAAPDAYGAPTSFTVTPDLPLDHQTVVIAQAALNHFFHAMRDAKVAETIANEAQSWGWQKSATLLNEYFKMLREQRDRALELAVAAGGGGGLEAYVSFLAVRDANTSAIIEPYVETALIGTAQVDYRWG
jgi:hypothetical protein